MPICFGVRFLGKLSPLQISKRTSFLGIILKTLLLFTKFGKTINSMETTIEISESQRRENMDMLIKKLIQSKKQEQKESKNRFKTDPVAIKALAELRKRNAERGTAIANL
jgi:hypothetical protein